MIESIGTVIAALLLVLALLIGLLYAARRFQLVPGAPAPNKRARELHIRETLPLNTNTRLLIVSWRGRDRLLAVGPNGVTVVADAESSLESVPQAMDDQSDANHAGPTL